MGLGRRKADVADQQDWIFNRVANAYGARPAYPDCLLDALATLSRPGAAIADIGAGLGHTAVPLAARGFDVCAIDPAAAMLEQLTARAQQRGVAVRTVTARAEALPLPAASVDAVILADALHFMDPELTGCEVARVLRPQGTLSIVSCEPAATPFMRAVGAIMAEAAPRRPRAVGSATVQVSRLADVTLGPPRTFHDATPVDPVTLLEILRSISFIGPAMNAARWQAFATRIAAIAEPAVWARAFTLRSGHRTPRAADGSRYS